MTCGPNELIRSLLDRPNVHCRDPTATAAILSRLIEDGARNLTVITDFDHTLTRSHDEKGGKCAVTHEVFGHPRRFPELCEEFTRFEKKYGRFEHLTDGEERIQMMEAWWRDSNEAIVRQAITRIELFTLVAETNIQLREGAAEFMDKLDQQSMPTLIFSAGIGDVITLALEQKMGGIPRNVHVISNKLTYDEEERIDGFSDPLIHCFNKSGAMIEESSPVLPLISSRPNVLLMGDALGDCAMVEGLDKDKERVLKIGFLNSKPNMLSHFLAAFDIVIVDDQTMQIPAEIMKMLA